MEDWITLDKMEGHGEETIEVTCAPNSVEEKRFTQIVIKSGKKYEKVVEVEQEEAEQVITIPEFDYLVASYEWAESAGKDFDTATCFLNTGLPGVDNQMVGWSRGMATTSWQVGDYLLHGGDNMMSGLESALINMNELLSDTNFPKLPEDIMIGIWGNWYEVKGTGAVTVRYVAYKGGKMYRDGYGFINKGGEMVYDGKANTTVKASGQNNNTDPMKLYTRFATIIYNKKTRDCFIQLAN